jgi:hypothetical protein
MNQIFQYDIFLSRNQDHQPRVRPLVKRLRIWLDERVIRAGDDIYLAIEHGVETSRRLVLGLSPAELRSDRLGARAQHRRSNLSLFDPSSAAPRCIEARFRSKL